MKSFVLLALLAGSNAIVTSINGKIKYMCNKYLCLYLKLIKMIMIIPLIV